MNGITINDRQYIFVHSDEETVCSDCDFFVSCDNTDHLPCLAIAGLVGIQDGVFKELKPEK